MKNYFLLAICFLPTFLLSQKKNIVKKKNSVVAQKTTIEQKLNDSVVALIPEKINGKFGFKDQLGKTKIPAEYSNVGFFTEDCQLQNSPNLKIRKFGDAAYASVRLNDKDFRINTDGKRVYQFKDEDRGKCTQEFRAQLFHAYILNGKYGIIEDATFSNPGDYRQFTIYPVYQYLHILEGDDLKNPMIIASHNNKFGIINIENKMIVPFQYADIKPNFSWKLARLLEVSEDGVNYFYIDINNRKY